MIIQDEDEEYVVVLEEEPPECPFCCGDSPSVDIGVVPIEYPRDSKEASSSGVSLVVQLTETIGPLEVGELLVIPPPQFITAVSLPSHFAFECITPLSQWSPSHFFSLGSCRSQEGRLQDDLLQIQFMYCKDALNVHQGFPHGHTYVEPLDEVFRK